MKYTAENSNGDVFDPDSTSLESAQYELWHDDHAWDTMRIFCDGVEVGSTTAGGYETAWLGATCTHKRFIPGDVMELDTVEAGA